MYPLTRSTSRSRFFGLPFSPSVLFAAGEQGAWYDPSDYSTLFQDVAGTTPVTAVEQFVRLMRDKSGRGNHATAPSDPARPILRARYNLLTYSEQFNNAYWTKGDSSAANTTATTDPLGGTTADKLTENTATNFHDVYVTSGVTLSAVSYTLSIYVKKAERTKVRVSLATAALAFGGGVRVDLNAGTIDSVINYGAHTGATATVAPSGNDWYRISLSITGTAALYYPAVAIVIGASTEIYTGDGTSGLYLWGADLRATNDALNQPAYQRVAAATDYDTNGFLPYLEFNGSTWSMSAAAIDFSGTDKMTVFAGVRKLSDAATGCLVELSAASFSNPGSFNVFSPANLAPEYFFGLRASALSRQGTATTYTAPITNVLACAYDIAQPTTALEIQPRINTLVPTMSYDGGESGTGNFGNYPLFIGARNSTLFPFNGRIYSLIIRGAASSASEIAATEAYINARTGAY